MKASLTVLLTLCFVSICFGAKKQPLNPSDVKKLPVLPNIWPDFKPATVTPPGYDPYKPGIHPRPLVITKPMIPLPLNGKNTHK